MAGDPTDRRGLQDLPRRVYARAGGVRPICCRPTGKDVARLVLCGNGPVMSRYSARRLLITGARWADPLDQVLVTCCTLLPMTLDAGSGECCPHEVRGRVSTGSKTGVQMWGKPV